MEKVKKIGLFKIIFILILTFVATIAGILYFSQNAEKSSASPTTNADITNMANTANTDATVIDPNTHEEVIDSKGDGITPQPMPIVITSTPEPTLRIGILPFITPEISPTENPVALPLPSSTPLFLSSQNPSPTVSSGDTTPNDRPEVTQAINVLPQAGTSWSVIFSALGGILVLIGFVF
jgi:hypothetical protein